MPRTVHRKKRLMSDMNVVPYIDVMLVLLVIFMITAPLITQSVDVELPQVPSEVVPPTPEEPVIVSVDKQGRYYVDIGEKPDEPLDAETLANRVAAIVKYKPKTPIIVRGDRDVPYGQVVTLMAQLQAAGIKGVGLMTEPLPK